MTKQSALNVVNVYYFAKHLSAWLCCLVLRRPDLAHYAIGPYWSLEKSVLFLKAARMCGAKTLGHLHSGGFIAQWAALPSWRREFALRELKRLRGLVVLSESWSEAVAREIGLPRERLFVVNNPIEQEFEEAALGIPIGHRAPVILSLGTLGLDKGVMDLLEAVRIASARAKFQLVLAGPERDPGIRERVLAFIRERGLGQIIEVRASVWGEEKLNLFREASIFVLPSYYENFPLVVIEAAAAGHAIITTPVGATPEFFKDGVSALFVEPKRPDQLASAIIRLVEHPEERERLGRAARETFRVRLARSMIMDAMNNVYQTVLSSPQAAAEGARRQQTGATGSALSQAAEGASSMPPDGEAHSAASYFGSQVGRWESLYERRLSFQDRLNLFVGAVRRSVPLPAKVLDFGCGPGIMSVELGQLGYDVLGVDGAGGMVQAARDKVARLALRNVRIEHMEAGALELPEEAFDAIICSSVIEYIKDDVGLLNKLARALRPGGHLFLSVPHTGSLLGEVEDFLRLSKRFLRREGSRHLNYALRRYKHQELARLLKDLGLDSRNRTAFEFPFFGNVGLRLSRCSLLGRMLLLESCKATRSHQEPADQEGTSRQAELPRLP